MLTIIIVSKSEQKQKSVRDCNYWQIITSEGGFKIIAGWFQYISKRLYEIWYSGERFYKGLI